MNGEAVLSKRRTWWRNRAAVLLAFATILTQLAFLPGTLATAGAQELLMASACVAVDDIDDVVPNVRSTLAAGNDVVLPPGNYYLLEGPLVLAGDADLSGTGGTAADTIVDGCGFDRVVDVTATATSTITNVTLIGGDTNGNNRGGGVRVQSGAEAELIDVYVVDNSAYEGGGLYNGGNTTVESSTFESNVASQKGGGIENDGVLTVVNSTLSNNTGKGGGGVSTAGTAYISYSTIYQNLSTNKIGAGTLRNGGTLSIVNSIVAQNIGSDGDFHDCSGTPDVDNVLFSSTQGCNPEGAYIIDLTELDPLIFTSGRTPTHPLPSENHAAVDAKGFIGPPDMFNEQIDCRVLPDLDPGQLLEQDQRGVQRGGVCDIGAHEFGDPLTISMMLSTSVDQIEVGAVTVPVGNIVPANTGVQQDDGGVASTPVGAIPVGAIPVGAIPVGAIPVGAIPVGAIPVGAIPVGAIPVGAIPVGAIGTALDSILLSELSMLNGDSLEHYLIGTPFQGVPLLSLNFLDFVGLTLDQIDFGATLDGVSNPIGAIALSDLPDEAAVVDCVSFACGATIGTSVAAIVSTATIGDALTFADVSFGSTALSDLPVGAIVLGGLPVGAIDITGTGIEATNISEWCSLLGQALCVGLGLDPDDLASDDDITLMTLALAGVPVGAIPVGAIGIEDLPVGAIPVGAIALDTLFWQSSPVGAIPVGAIDFASAPVGAIPVGAIPVGAIDTLVDCTLVDCLSATTTLADVDLANAWQDGVLFGDLAQYLDEATIADLEGIFGDTPPALSGYTLADLIYLLIPPSEIPWDEIPDINEARFPDAANPKQPAFDTVFDVDMGGDFPAGITLHLRPPAGFLFAKDGVADGEPVEIKGPGDPSYVPSPLRPTEITEDDAAAGLLKGDLVLDLGTLDPGEYSIQVAMRAGLVLGEFSLEGTATATPTAGTCADGGSSCSASDSASIVVVEALSGDSGDLGSVPLLIDGNIQLSHVSSSDDLDLFKFVVDGNTAGTVAQILLSHNANDNDLVLYGPPLAAPLRVDTLPGFAGIADFVFGLSPDEETLTTDTLQDIPHDPAQVGLAAENVVLHAVSAKRGLNDELIDTGTLQEGTYFVQVSPYNGTFSNEPYLLRLRVIEGPEIVCQSTGFPYSDTGLPALPSPGDFTGLNTLFLYNHQRLLAEYPADAGDVLAELAMVTSTTDWVDAGVVGAVLPIDADTGVLTAFQALQMDRCNPHASNDVVREIGQLIDSFTAVHDIEYIVVVGDDAQVPYARIPDGTAISNERVHGLTFAAAQRGNEIISSLLQGYYFSDHVYGADYGTSVNNHEIFLMTRAVGRVGEDAASIAQTMANFRAFEGLLDPSSGGLVTGYDFLTDGANEIVQKLIDEGFDVPVANQLISETWTKAQLEAFLAAPDFSVLSLNGHADENRILPADGNLAGGGAELNAAELFSSSDLPPPISDPPDNNALVNNSKVIFSMGCHLGLSLSDVLIGSSLPDWAQAIGASGDVLAANSGFGYGDTAVVGLSEWLSSEFAGRLGSTTTGKALVGAVQAVASNLFTIDPYHEKIIMEFNHQGLPMWRTGPADASLAVASLPAPGESTAGSGLNSTGVGPASLINAGLLPGFPLFPSAGTGPAIINDPMTGLDFSFISPDLSGLQRHDVAGVGAYYQVDDEPLLAMRARPAEPLTGVDVTQPDGSGGLARIAGAALVTGLTSFQDQSGVPGVLPDPGFDFVSFTPVPDIGDAVDPSTVETYRPMAGDATFPSGITRIAPFVDDDGQASQRALFVPGRFVAEGPSGLPTQEVFTEIHAQVFYQPQNSTDTTAPLIKEAIGWYGGDVVFFEVTIEGDGQPDDVSLVHILFRPNDAIGETEWLGVYLSRLDDDTWVGGRDVGDFDQDEFEFIVQALDSSANYSVSTFKGLNYLTAEPSLQTVVGITPSGAQGNFPWWLSDVTATASVSNGGGEIVAYRLDRGPIVGWDGGVQGQPNITGSGGHFLEVFSSGGDVGVLFVAIDTDEPQVVLSAEPDLAGFYSASNLPTVTLDATDATSGVGAIKYTINGGAAQDYTAPFALLQDDVSGGAIDFGFFAFDAAGNQSTPGSRIFQVDLTAPSITIVNPSAGEQFEMGTAAGTYDFTCTDAESGSPTCLGTDGDGGAVADGDTIDTSTEGDFSLTVNSTDAAGNAATPVTHNFTVRDTVEPSVAHVVTGGTQGGDGWYTTDVTVKIVADPLGGTGISAIECSFDGGAFANCGTLYDDGTDKAVDVSVSSNGVTTIDYRAKDSAVDGHNIGAGSVTIKLDKQVPIVTLIFYDELIGGVDPNVISGPFSIGQDVFVRYICTDAHSGVAPGSCPADELLDTLTPGAFSFDREVFDVAGNSTTATVDYDVVYGICLQYDPTKEAPSTGAVPIKVQVCDFGPDGLPNTEDDINLSSNQIILTGVLVALPEPGNGNGPLLPSVNDTGKANDDFEFRFNPKDGFYVYNLNVNELVDPSTGEPVALNPEDDAADNPFVLLFTVTEDPLPTVLTEFGEFPDPTGFFLYEGPFTLK